MKKIIISTIISANFIFGAGIPTIDTAAISQSLAQNIKEIQEWKEYAQRWQETTKHYSSQLTAYENELLSKTGIRDSVNFVKDLNRLQKYAKAYGDDYLNLAQALANPNSRVGNLARNLFDKYNVFDRCQNSHFKEWEKKSCKNKLEREVQQIAVVQESNKLVDASSKNLEDLSKKISNTKDIKESQDIANAINMEIAQLKVVQMKMDMLSKQQEAQRRAEEEQKKQEIVMLREYGQGTHLLNAK